MSDAEPTTNKERSPAQRILEKFTSKPSTEVQHAYETNTHEILTNLLPQSAQAIMQTAKSTDIEMTGTAEAINSDKAAEKVSEPKITKVPGNAATHDGKNTQTKKRPVSAIDTTPNGDNQHEPATPAKQPKLFPASKIDQLRAEKKSPPKSSDTTSDLSEHKCFDCLKHRKKCGKQLPVCDICAEQKRKCKYDPKITTQKEIEAWKDAHPTPQRMKKMAEAASARQSEDPPKTPRTPMSKKKTTGSTGGQSITIRDTSSEHTPTPTARRASTIVTTTDETDDETNENLAKAALSFGQRKPPTTMSSTKIDIESSKPTKPSDPVAREPSFFNLASSNDIKETGNSRATVVEFYQPHSTAPTRVRQFADCSSSTRLFAQALCGQVFSFSDRQSAAGNRVLRVEISHADPVLEFDPDLGLGLGQKLMLLEDDEDDWRVFRESVALAEEENNVGALATTTDCAILVVVVKVKSATESMS